MPLYVHRTTFQVLPSTSPVSLSEPEANYVKDPSPWPFTSEPSKYWQLDGDVFSLVDQATRDAIDAAIEVARLDGLADQVGTDALLRAVSKTNLDLFNAERAARGAPTISAAQYKANVRGNL